MSADLWSFVSGPGDEVRVHLDVDAIVQRMAQLEEKVTRDAVVQKLRELGYTVKEPLLPSEWKCSRCGSDRWVGHRYGPAQDGHRRNAQCVPCGHVQPLPEGEPQ